MSLFREVNRLTYNKVFTIFNFCNNTSFVVSFGVVDMEKDELGDYFPEFFALKQHCKFNNCIHVNEPHCAVKEALDNEEISWSRYKSYLQILEGEEENYRTDIWK